MSLYHKMALIVTQEINIFRSEAPLWICLLTQSDSHSLNNNILVCSISFKITVIELSLCHIAYLLSFPACSSFCLYFRLFGLVCLPYCLSLFLFVNYFTESFLCSFCDQKFTIRWKNVTFIFPGDRNSFLIAASELKVKGIYTPWSISYEYRSIFNNRELPTKRPWGNE